MAYTNTGDAVDRAALKSRIQDLQTKAQQADQQMRAALRRFNVWAAYAHRRERDRYNAEARRLSSLLSQPPASSTTLTPPSTQPSRQLSAAQQRRRRQLINHEIPHAQKVLAEYRRHGNARKIVEYEHKLRVLQAELDALNGTRPTTPPDNNTRPPPASAEAQRRLQQLEQHEIPHTERMLAEYRRYGNQQKIAATEQKLRALKAERDRLRGRNPQPPNDTTRPPPPHDGNNTSQFISRLANEFNQNGNQDAVHNALLKELLNNKYSHETSAAYNVIRNNSGQPLYQVRNQDSFTQLFHSLAAVDQRTKQRFPHLDLQGKRMAPNFFIRDFLQAYCTGSISVANLVLVDDALYSSFARDFDRLVGSVNEYQRSQGRRRRVFFFSQLAHRDAIQLIPNPMNGVDHFGGAIMRNVSVSGNVIYSDGALQGIFASDGAFQNLHIRNNHLRIGGQHTISINGMLSGSIMDNTDHTGKPLAMDKITLYPLRLGGGANIFILGFHNKAWLNPDDPNYYQYDTIYGVPPERDFRQQVTQHRGSYYRDVDMQELQTLLKQHGRPTASGWQSIMNTLENQGFARRVSS